MRVFRHSVLVCIKPHIYCINIPSVFSSALPCQVTHISRSRRTSLLTSSMSMEDGNSLMTSEEAQHSFTTQLLLLYYLLLYQDSLHNNYKNICTCNALYTQHLKCMCTFKYRIISAQSSSTVHQYSAQLWDQLPLKYLLQQANKQQQLFAGLYAPILKYVCINTLLHKHTGATCT